MSRLKVIIGELMSYRGIPGVSIDYEITPSHVRIDMSVFSKTAYLIVELSDNIEETISRIHKTMDFVNPIEADLAVKKVSLF